MVYLWVYRAQLISVLVSSVIVAAGAIYFFAFGLKYLLG